MVILPGSASSLTRNPLADRGQGIFRMDGYNAENYQLMDADSRSKCAKNLLDGNNAKINNSQGSLPRSKLFPKLKYEHVIKLTNKPHLALL
jgi:hypothetical protein